MFEYNHCYTLRVVKKTNFSQSDYAINNAIYVGSYTHFGRTSHRFLHLVNNESLKEFVGLWTRMAANFVLCGKGMHEEVPGMNVLYTDVYEILMEKHGDLVTVNFPYQPAKSSASEQGTSATLLASHPSFEM